MNPLSTRLKEHDGHAWHLPLKDYDPKVRTGMDSWALDRLGTPYDYGGIIKQLSGHISSSAKKLWCSETWQDAFEQGAAFDAQARIDYHSMVVKLKGMKAQPGDLPGMPCFRCGCIPIL
jgi:hypothetical protein